MLFWERKKSKEKSSPARMATLGSTSCWKILRNFSVFCPQLLHFSTFPNESWNKQNPHVNCLSYQKINKFDRLFSEILANISAPTYVGHPVFQSTQRESIKWSCYFEMQGMISLFLKSIPCALCLSWFTNSLFLLLLHATRNKTKFGQ